MEPKDWFVVSMSGAALLWSVISYFLNKASAGKASARADDANRLAQETGRRITAETEISLIRLINEARMRTNELCRKVTELKSGRTQSKISADENRLIASMDEAYNEAVEVLLNSYELACGLYLDDGKLDNTRFERQYGEEIKSLFDLPEPYKDRLHRVNSPYNAILTVRNKWCNPENK